MVYGRAPGVRADPRLPGRQREIRLIAAGYQAAVSGVPTLIRVRGPSGMGSTALLRALRFPGAEVLRAAPAEPGSRQVPFSVARELLSAVPGARAAASRAAELTVTEATLRELSAPVLMGLAARPVVLVVDGLHRCDEGSLRWLDFLLSRGHGLPLFLLASQASNRAALASAALTEMIARHGHQVVELSPLPVAAIAEVLRQRFGCVPHHTFTRHCAEVSGGRPVLLAQIIAVLRAGGITPDEHSVDLAAELTGPLVCGAVRECLRGLPGYVRRVAAATVMLGPAADHESVAAVAQVSLELVDVAMSAARAEGVFASAAVASAARGVLTALSEAERKELRLRAVEVLRDSAYDHGDLSPAPTTLNEEWLVSLLGEASGWPALAACAPGEETHVVFGQLAAALRSSPDPLRRGSLAVSYSLASVVLRRGAEALTPLEESLAELPVKGSRGLTSAQRALRTRLEAAVAVVGADSTSLIRGMTTRSLAPRTAGNAVTEQCLLAARSITRALTSTDLAGARDDARRAARQFRTDPGGWAAITSARSLHLCDDIPAALDVLNQVVSQNQEQRHPWLACVALSLRSQVLAEVGEVSRAHADGAAATRIAQYRCGPGEIASARIARAALLADAGLAGHAERLLLGVEPGCLEDSVWDYHQYLLVIADIRDQRGDLDGAVDALSACGRSQAAAGITNPVFTLWWKRGAWILAKLGRRREAAEWVSKGTELSAGWPTPRSQGLSLLAQSAVESGPAQVELLERAIDVLRQSPARAHLIKSQYFLGQALLQVDDRAGARECLRQAALAATRHGFTRLARDSRALLLAAGGRMPLAGGAAPHDMLTARERTVAELVGQGLSNVAIAETLFVTVRTVEFHLSNVYRKLGLTGRAAIKAALPGASVPAGV